jgi:predicted  nucleic acid-binding Zn-ribbon protein
MAIDRRVDELEAAITEERQERESQNAADDEQFEALGARLGNVENEQVRFQHRLKWLEDRIAKRSRGAGKRRSRAPKPAP